MCTISVQHFIGLKLAHFLNNIFQSYIDSVQESIMQIDTLQNEVGDLMFE